MRDRIRRACFDAVAAENAARIIDIVNAGVTFTGGDAVGIGIFRRFDINAICWASRGAQKAANALLEAGSRRDATRECRDSAAENALARTDNSL